MKVLLIGGPHNGRELKDSDVTQDADRVDGQVRILNVQSTHDKNVYDIYTFLEEKPSGVSEFLYHSSREMMKR